MKKLFRVIALVALCLFEIPGMTSEFHIVTVASKKRQGLTRLLESCKKYDLSIKVLGLNQPYRYNTKKLTYVNKYLKALADDDIVLFVDGYDVFFLADQETILSKFYEFNADLIIAAEIGYTHFPDKTHYTYPPSPTRFRYINSGTYMGYVGAIKKMLQEFEPWELKKHDQELFHRYFLNYPAELKLDYQCELFFPLCQLEPEAVEVIHKERKVLLLDTMSKPLIIHGAGSGFRLYLRLYKQLFPKRRRKTVLGQK